MSASEEIVGMIPLPAAWHAGGLLVPNAQLLSLLGREVGAFAAPGEVFELLFGDRAAAYSMQHESDRVLGFPAPRLCALSTAAGRQIPVEWASSTVGEAEVWVFRPERVEGDLPIGSYGITQEDVGDMLYWVDEQANIRSVNGSACEAMGFTPEEFLAKNIRDIDPNFTEEGWPRLWQRIKQSKRARLESRHRKKSGEIIEVDILAQFAIVGGVEYACSTVRDITESKARSAATEQDLAERETLLANLVGMVYRCEVDADYTFTYVSSGALMLTGYRAEEILGTPPVTFAMLVHPEDLARVNAECATGIASRAPFALEYRICCKDGGIKWVQDLARAISGADGTPTAVEGFITDITLRKQAEQAVLESQLLFSSFMDNSPAFAFIKDEDGRLLYVNRTFVDAIWQGCPPDWQGKLDNELWPSESATAFRENDLAVLRGGEAMRFDESLEDPNGVREHYITIKFPLRVPGGKLLLAGLGLNVSEQRQAAEVKRRMEEQMLHMQKLESLGVLAGGIAHDFNNLLTGVMGYADLALFDVPEDSSAAQSIGQIAKSARRAAELTRQMLAYSGKGTFVVQAFCLGQVLRDMASLLEVAVSKRCQMVYALQEGLPSIEGDPTQVRQVLMNLVINASEAIGDNDGVIRVSTGLQRCTRAMLRSTYLDEGLPEGNYVYVEVADSGCGMDEETRKKLFDPFFTTKFAGRGLGMAAVLGIVRSHRAAISVESAEGKGSTFRLYFPASGLAAQPEPRDPQYVNARFRGTILVVDDEATVRQLAEEILRKLGFRVLVAANGVEAMEIYRAQRNEVGTVLLDATMPLMDGPETLRALRSDGAKVRVILSSGYSEANIAEQCGDTRPDAFIEKPYTIGRLVQVLSSLGQYDEAPRA